MKGTNKIAIAAAGSGKTTHLIREALKVSGENVLITTYTESNEAEIKKKFLELNGHIPGNIFVTTWFTFLIRDGVRPFQGVLFDFDVKGMVLTERQSGLRYVYNGRPGYWGESDFEKYYFDSQRRIYSDKLSKLVMRCNERSDGDVFDRISRVYKHIYVDEVQDLAGYDLDVLAQFFLSDSNILLVGDPRQVTYQTHHERRYTKYSGGKLLEFFEAELPRRTVYEVDESTLSVSHRNGDAICAVSSKLFPAFGRTQACTCEKCRTDKPAGSGLFVVRQARLKSILMNFCRFSSGIVPQARALAPSLEQ